MLTQSVRRGAKEGTWVVVVHMCLYLTLLLEEEIDPSWRLKVVPRCRSFCSILVGRSIIRMTVRIHVCIVY